VKNINGRTVALVMVLCIALGAAGAWAWRVSHPPVSYRLAEWPRGAQLPSLSLVDDDGRQRTLADYRGRVVVLYFGFLRCPNACPAELFKLALATKQLGPLRDRVQVLFVTLDPERDTPAMLRDYVTAFDPHFVGLTGNPVQVAKVPQGDDYSIDHSTGTYILDATGRLRLLGAMDTSIADYVHDLQALATT
jgi:protein SCO1